MESIKSKLQDLYDHKKVLILGFGKEGRSTYQLLKNNCQADLFIMDQHEDVVKEYLDQQLDVHTKVLASDEYLKNLQAFDIIFKTPGLPGYLLHQVPSSQLTSQSQLFLDFLGERCIGITGTKGKSTTSGLIAHILSEAGVNVKLIGNIGYPALQCLLEDDGETLYVYEMSSFQTEFLQTGPRIGVILNLFQEHLNNYEGYEAYQQSKLQLFKAQVKNPEKQVLIYGCDNHILLNKIKALRHTDEVRQFRAFGNLLKNTLSDDGYFIEEESIVKIENDQKIKVSSINFSRKLLGKHNLLNSLVGFIIVDVLVKEKVIKPITQEEVIKSLSTFSGLPHRLEEVGTYNGITFYNDSISTIPEAAIKAIEAVESLGTLIIGGFDRKIDYQQFANYLDGRKDIAIICMPDTGYQIYDLMKDKHRCFQVQDMVEAVDKAYEITPIGKACLLSPAASSYNQYKNFEERGDHFVECMKRVGTYEK